MANNHSVESQVSGTPVMLFQTPIALIVFAEDRIEVVRRRCGAATSGALSTFLAAATHVYKSDRTWQHGAAQSLDPQRRLLCDAW